jgi:hypothetical protein
LMHGSRIFPSAIMGSLSSENQADRVRFIA